MKIDNREEWPSNELIRGHLAKLYCRLSSINNLDGIFEIGHEVDQIIHDIAKLDVSLFEESEDHIEVKVQMMRNRIRPQHVIVGKTPVELGSSEWDYVYGLLFLVLKELIPRTYNCVYKESYGFIRKQDVRQDLMHLVMTRVNGLVSHKRNVCGKDGFPEITEEIVNDVKLFQKLEQIVYILQISLQAYHEMVFNPEQRKKMPKESANNYEQMYYQLIFEPCNDEIFTSQRSIMQINHSLKLCEELFDVVKEKMVSPLSVMSHVLKVYRQMLIFQTNRRLT